MIKKWSSSAKFEIALLALKGETTLNELCKKYEVSPSQVHAWGRSGQPRKLDANQEALMIAMCCTEPPQGRCRWTLSMLGEQMVSLTEVDNISLETIRQRLKENDLKPWQKKMWCIAKLDAAYIARMEHIRRIPSKEKLIKELAAWEKARNNVKASINWMFNVNTAREKLDKAYAKLTCQN